MHLQVNINQTQSLKLSLTKELKQSIEMLQFSALELVYFLQIDRRQVPVEMNVLLDQIGWEYPQQKIK
ncbi:hypothetical protein E3U55_15805 [Filobacillus milosensis]|uniref:Uncharacterized protein n=1 Tax=Filobacillus milosensis TaxID=94137 RepID=A0A4Y8ICF0_9BACI|nr:hypothetical protein [Filobacillus milosensis]TFB13584.1 hypothetical protein E3U55_15805 [Filobacillus milosensis]